MALMNNSNPTPSSQQKSDEYYRAVNDSETLMRAQEILSDKARLTQATKILQQREDARKTALATATKALKR